MITVSMACGHTVKIADTDDAVACSECGERRVSNVKARAPKFRGVVLGPCAQFESLTGVPVVVGEGDAERSTGN